MTQHFLFKIILLIFMSIGFLSINSCKDNNTHPVKKSNIHFKKEATVSIYKTDTDSLIVKLDSEIADDAYQRETGLMYRDQLEEHQSMLFVFPDEQYRSFYMKNTKIPLDIIYINAEKHIVSIQKNAKPFDETSLPSEAPAKYVLEINAGLVDTWNINIGDRIDF